MAHNLNSVTHKKKLHLSLHITVFTCEFLSSDTLHLLLVCLIRIYLETTKSTGVYVNTQSKINTVKKKMTNLVFSYHLVS